MSPPDSKQLLFCWVANGFNVLAPKRRGTGFLRVPYGHHPDTALDAIADLVHVDVIGLDGSLHFECKGAVFHGPQELRDAFAGKVVPALERHYGLCAKEIDEVEFWQLHPLECQREKPISTFKVAVGENMQGSNKSEAISNPVDFELSCPHSGICPLDHTVFEFDRRLNVINQCITDLKIHMDSATAENARRFSVCPRDIRISDGPPEVITGDFGHLF